MTSQVILTLQDGTDTKRVEATRVQFSAHQCFSTEDAETVECLTALGNHLARETGLAVYGTGLIFAGLIRHCPALLPRICALVRDELCEEPIPPALAGVPVVAPADLGANISTVFICETRAYQRQRMRGRLPERLKILDPDVLTKIALHSIPTRAWTSVARHIYPIAVPEIRFRNDLDLLLMDCPARNLALMPNGLAYVHNALKKTSVNFQTFDLDIVTYHRYHIRRLFDDGGTIVMPSGREMPVDPWQAEHYDLWADPEVIQYLIPIIDEAAAEVIRARPKILGLSIQQCSEAFSRQLVQRVKAALPETIILVGGFSCYSADTGLRSFPEADYMCIGESDLTVGPLVEALARGERPRDVAGVVSRHDTPSRLFAPAPMPHNLDQIEFPKYEWCDLSIYRNYNGYQLVPIIASRGCRWARCTFCAERFYWRIRSAKNFVEELRWLADQGCTLFMFNESDLNGMPDKLLGICDEIIRSGIKVKLTGQLRINKKSDRAFFDKLRAAGFVALRFGVDAFSENTLRLQKKGYTTAMVSQNLKDCWEAGIYTEVNWVIGVPGETDEDCDDGVKFILHNRRHIGRLVNINPLILVNGGVYWIDPEAHNIKFRTPKEELYARNPRGLPADQWYSTEPYIDAQIRRERFQRIVLGLHEAGFPVGAWANRVIEDVRLARDRSRAGLGQATLSGVLVQDTEEAAVAAINAAIQTGEANDASNATSVVPSPINAAVESPRLVRTLAAHNVIGYGGKFYGLAHSLGDMDLAAIDPKTIPGVVIAETEEAVIAEIETAVKWANSRGQIDDQQRQRERGSAYRVDSAPVEQDRPQPAPTKPVLVEFAGTAYAVTCESWAGLMLDAAMAFSVINCITKNAVPELWTLIGNYNVVEFDGRYYGVPRGLPIDWESGQAAAQPGVITAGTANELMRILRDETGSIAEAPAPAPASGLDRAMGPTSDNSRLPLLVGTIENYNLVAYEGWIYGVPHSLGPIDLSEIDIIGMPGVFRDVSYDVVENEIRERIAKDAERAAA